MAVICAGSRVLEMRKQMRTFATEFGLLAAEFHWEHATPA